MIKIEHTKVYGIDTALRYNGLPMSENPKVSVERAIRLGSVPRGSGHDNYLKGIVVQFLLTAPHYFIIQLQRYKFVDIVSSTSKMHMLGNKEFFINNLPKEIPDSLKNELIGIYDKYETYPTEINFRALLNSIPLGFTLKEFLTTNYLSLKNIYYQRKNHKLQEWHIFCDWILQLPYMDKILEVKDENIHRSYSVTVEKNHKKRGIDENI